VAEDLLDQFGARDRVVAGDDRVGVERGEHSLEHLDGTGDRAHEQERCAAGEE